MSAAKVMTIALRVIFVCVALALIWWLSTHNLKPAGAIVLGIAGVVVSRMLVRNRLIENPAGDSGRTFSGRPVLWDVIRAAGCLLVSLLWAGIMTEVARYYRPLDTEWFAIGVVGLPAILLLLMMGFFLGRAGFRGMFGTAEH